MRQVAIAAGIGKTAAADQLKRLAEQGLIDRNAPAHPWLVAVNCSIGGSPLTLMS